MGGHHFQRATELARIGRSRSHWRLSAESRSVRILRADLRSVKARDLRRLPLSQGTALERWLAGRLPRRAESEPTCLLAGVDLDLQRSVGVPADTWDVAKHAARLTHDCGRAIRHALLPLSHVLGHVPGVG